MHGVTQNLAEMGSLNRSLLLSEWYRRRPPPPPQGHQDCAFSIPANLPYLAGNPWCCTDCSTTVRLGGYDDTLGRPRELTCEIWRFVS